MFTTKYRIVRDAYNGYEVQYRKWWMPLFMMAASNGAGRGINTFGKLDEAKDHIRKHRITHKIVYEE